MGEQIINNNSYKSGSYSFNNYSSEKALKKNNF